MLTLIGTIDRHASVFAALSLFVIVALGAIAFVLYRDTPTLHIFFTDIMTTFAASLLITLAGTLLLDVVYRSERE